MIEVDISHVWSGISLPDFLAIEKDVAAAHSALMDEEENRPDWMQLPRRKADEEILRLLTAAQTVRSQSEICVIVGRIPGAHAVLDMLYGSRYSPDKSDGNPRILFAGNSYDTREWEMLQHQLEGKDYSIFAANLSSEKPEAAIAFRGLRWQLERRLGTEEAARRIYVAAAEESALWNLAQQQHWECFALPSQVEESHGIFTAAELFPLAVAGIDIMELLCGAADALDNYDLRSFENPLWLYAGMRNALFRRGKRTELFAGLPTGFRSLSVWWQQLFARWETSGSIFPVGAAYPEDQYIWKSRISSCPQSLFETLLRFEPEVSTYSVTSDVSDWDGLNHLAGKQLEEVEQDSFFALLDTHCDSGMPVITMDCGKVSARSMGELFAFLALACEISSRIAGSDREIPE